MSLFSKDKNARVKDSFSVKRVRPQYQSYPAISKRLHIYYGGATPPRPDPGHLVSSLTGVSGRAALKTPDPDPQLQRKLKDFVWQWLKNKSGLMPLGVDEIFTFEEWLHNTTYSETRKAELTKYWDTDICRKPSRRLLRKVKCFIKDETYPTWKFSRGIYSRSDAAKCLFGPLVQSVSKQVFKLPWFIKNIPVVDRPQAIADRLLKPGARYMFTDYTAYESHFTKELMEICDQQLFKFMFSKSPADVKEVISMFMEAKTGKQKMTFKLFDCEQEAGRMSGEVDTSLCNGFANLMLFLFACQESGIDIDKVVGFVEGDDGLFRFIVEGDCIPDEALFRKLGMTIKIGITDKLSEASFCGQVYDMEEKVVVADPREVVCRLGWTNKKYVNAGPSVLQELLRSRGYSLVYQYGKCPILGALGKKILDLTKTVTVRDSIVFQMDEWERDRYNEAKQYIDKHGTEITGVPGPNTRALVQKLYEISTVEQESIEKAIEGMVDLGALPFRFEKEPVVWREYYERYSVGKKEMVPVWLKSNEAKSVNELVDVGAVTDLQALRILRGGVGG